MRILVWLVLLAGLLAAPSGAEIYRWTDADGQLHFSDRLNDVPPEYRAQTSQAQPPDEGQKGFNWGSEGDLPVLPGEADGTTESEAVEMPDLGFDPNQAQELLEQIEGPMLAVILVVALTVLGFSQ